MKNKTRMWISFTILVIIVINYLIIGVPLMGKSIFITAKIKAVLAEQAKPDLFFKKSDHEYLLEIFRKEKASVDRTVKIVNTASLTALLLLTSWTIFGLIFRRKRD